LHIFSSLLHFFARFRQLRVSAYFRFDCRFSTLSPPASAFAPSAISAHAWPQQNDGFAAFMLPPRCAASAAQPDFIHAGLDATIGFAARRRRFSIAIFARHFFDAAAISIFAAFMIFTFSLSQLSLQALILASSIARPFLCRAPPASY